MIEYLTGDCLDSSILRIERIERNAPRSMWSEVFLTVAFYIVYTPRFQVPNSRIKCPASSNDRTFYPWNFSIAVQIHQATFGPYTKNGSASPSEVKRQLQRNLVGTKTLQGSPVEQCWQVTSRSQNVWTGTWRYPRYWHNTERGLVTHFQWMGMWGTHRSLNQSASHIPAKVHIIT